MLKMMKLLTKTKAFVKSNFMMLVVMTTSLVTLVYVEDIYTRVEYVEFTTDNIHSNIDELHKEIENVDNDVINLQDKTTVRPLPTYYVPQHAPVLGVQTPTDPDCTD